LILFVSILLEKTQKVLLIRRFNTGYHDGKYILPGGRIEQGETIKKAALRELQEEVAVSPKELELAHVIHINGEDDELIGFIFKADAWSNEPKNNEPNKCDQIGWHPIHKLPENTAPYVKQALQCIHQGINYSQLYWK
jgi:mutator protein MutT